MLCSLWNRLPFNLKPVAKALFGSKIKTVDLTYETGAELLAYFSSLTILFLRKRVQLRRRAAAGFSTDTTTTPPPVVTTNPDHYPLTAASHWVYDDLTFPGDSIITTILGDTVIGSQTYKRVDEYKSFYPATNGHYYTKSGADYFRYASVSGFTSAFNFSPSLYDDFNYLKENLNTGSTWRSGTYNGRTSLGVQVKVLRYSFTCLDADASFSVNNRLFVHVYKIQMIPEQADPGTPLQPTGEVHTLYYAKGIGLIYQEFFNGVLPHAVLAIRSWKVN